VFHTLIKIVRRVAREATRALSAATRSFTDLMRRAWTRHRHLMGTNPAYRTALVGGVSTIVAQVSLGRLAAAVVLALIGVYAAVHQDTGTSGEDPPPPNYSDRYYAWGQDR